ncbi:UDP-2,4-diacetamido-2,4,6-trideoxy-beta-L-altropyranose hydrolase [Bacterioplanoides sp.]|uniref:UDP-2,4-diacetamido-2,4, 6-trideoxy-beta-L-altropyranose hydrolase n=1 Tax=Bacterioplanoides sp. TaxID=2066072 RepID=UPI003AFFBD64
MKVAFRCDGSVLIGTGHVMRCLALADALYQSGHEVVFIYRHMTNALKNILKERGFGTYSLLQDNAVVVTSTVEKHTPDKSKQENPYLHWLGVSEEQDAADTLQVLNSIQVDWLIVDHYALTLDWHQTIKTSGCQLLIIDDLDRPYAGDLSLDPNKVDDFHRLSGPQYALIHSRFSQHAQALPARSKLSRVLIFFGGIDSGNITSIALHGLMPLLEQQPLILDVVVGKQNPNIDTVKTLCDHPNIQLYIQTDQMPELMASADLFIGAAGSANWERCVMGLPAVLCTLADNQKVIAEQSQQHDSALYLGEGEAVEGEDFNQAVQSLMQNNSRVQQLSINAQNLCDGHGCRRVIAVMENMR